MPNVASWYVNGTFLSAWYSAVDAEELPASAAAFVEMSRNAAFQSGTAAEGGAAMAAMADMRKITICCLAAALLMIGLGLWRGEADMVLHKGVNLCLECVGIG